MIITKSTKRKDSEGVLLSHQTFSSKYSTFTKKSISKKVIFLNFQMMHPILSLLNLIHLLFACSRDTFTNTLCVSNVLLWRYLLEGNSLKYFFARVKDYSSLDTDQLYKILKNPSLCVWANRGLHHMTVYQMYISIICFFLCSQIIASGVKAGHRMRH
jgi:hypothetical protein